MQGWPASNGWSQQQWSYPGKLFSILLASNTSNVFSFGMLRRNALLSSLEQLLSSVVPRTAQHFEAGKGASQVLLTQVILKRKTGLRRQEHGLLLRQLKKPSNKPNCKLSNSLNLVKGQNNHIRSIYSNLHLHLGHQLSHPTNSLTNRLYRTWELQLMDMMRLRTTMRDLVTLAKNHQVSFHRRLQQDFGKRKRSPSSRKGLLQALLRRLQPHPCPRCHLHGVLHRLFLAAIHKMCRQIMVWMLPPQVGSVCFCLSPSILLAHVMR